MRFAYLQFSDVNLFCRHINMQCKRENIRKKKKNNKQSHRIVDSLFAYEIKQKKKKKKTELIFAHSKFGRYDFCRQGDLTIHNLIFYSV